jgi:hypothetical protein
MIQTPTEPFHTTLKRIVDKSKIGNKEFASKLAVHYRSFLFWLNGERGCPAIVVPVICNLVNNYELLDHLEHLAGREAFKLPPHPDGALNKYTAADARAVQKLVKEVSEALKELADTLADGVVKKDEYDRTIPKLDAVIQESAQLKRWLKMRRDADEAQAKKKKEGNRRR